MSTPILPVPVPNMCRSRGAPPPLELSVDSMLSVDASGGRLPGVSKFALNYEAEWRIPSGAFAADGEFHVGVDGNLRSDFPSNPTPSAVQNVEGHVLTNVRGGYRTGGG